MGSSTDNPQEGAWLMKRNFIFHIQIPSSGPKSRVAENYMICHTIWDHLPINLGRGRGLGNEISYIIFLQSKNYMDGLQINGCTQYMNEKIKITLNIESANTKEKKLWKIVFKLSIMTIITNLNEIFPIFCFQPIVDFNRFFNLHFR